MAANLGGDHDQPLSDINITPFVDIILVVLIIFMVTTPIIMKPSININLPKAASGDESTPSQLNLSVARDGKVLLNGKETNDEEIRSQAKQLVATKPDIQAIISADQDVTHGSVIRVIDLVKSMGVKKFAISTEKQAGNK